jgi:N utilization substance protein B
MFMKSEKNILCNQIKKPSMRKKARKYLIQGIYQWHLSGTAIKTIEIQFLETMNPKKVDIAYFQAILSPCLSHIFTLDELLTPILSCPIEKVNPVELAILRLACYELKIRLDIPYKVIINEALDLTKTFGASEGHRFVNGILDHIAKILRPTEKGLPINKQ